LFISKSTACESVEKDNETNAQDYGHITYTIARVNTVHPFVHAYVFLGFSREDLPGHLRCHPKDLPHTFHARSKDKQHPEQFSVISFLSIREVAVKKRNSRKFGISTGRHVTKTCYGHCKYGVAMSIAPKSHCEATLTFIAVGAVRGGVLFNDDLAV